MKGLFAEFRRPSAAEIAEAWENGLFVFDTSVLLNLYRYREEARREMLEVLTKLSARVWIPHHVALEFHRNRLSVIASQSRGFDDVRSAVRNAEKSLANSIGQLNLEKRHSSIDAGPLLKGIKDVVENFMTHLSGLEEAKQTLTGPDPILEAIDGIFDGRVGLAPDDQAALDALYSEAEERIKRDFPPGMRDLQKEELAPYCSGGLVYKAVYGDVLVWQQILAYALEMKIKQLVFVTDDGKDDWWRTVKTPATQTVGPRTEIVEEAMRRASVSSFVMYRMERFLKYAKDHLNADVSAETLAEAKELSNRRKVAVNFQTSLWDSLVPQEATFRYLAEKYENVESGGNVSEFVAFRNGREHTYRVVESTVVDNDKECFDLILGAIRFCESPDIVKYCLVFVVDDIREARRLTRKLRGFCVRSELKGARKLRYLVATIDKDQIAFDFVQEGRVVQPSSHLNRLTPPHSEG